MSEQSDKIRDLNDRFRKGDLSVPGHKLITRDLINTLADENIGMELLWPLISEYDEFNAENDPHGEHDFGQFNLNDHKCFWKIDVMDPSLELAPLDPTDPTLSVRVLTVMLATDW